MASSAVTIIISFVFLLPIMHQTDTVSRLLYEATSTITVQRRTARRRDQWTMIWVTTKASPHINFCRYY